MLPPIKKKNIKNKTVSEQEGIDFYFQPSKKTILAIQNTIEVTEFAYKSDFLIQSDDDSADNDFSLTVRKD